MVNFILRLLFGTKAERDIKKIQPTVDLINSLEPEIRQLPDEQLSAKTNEFRERLKKGETPDDILPEAFAVVREAGRRILGERPYDVQLLGGIVLHQGKIAEMKTGEGKTLASTMPIYLNALSRKGVHVITVNDYLARRDREWMGPIYEFLGLSIGVIQHDMPLEQKQLAYSCDITYGTNNEFGFDYLRDNMIPNKRMKMQRELNYCIVDEVDSVLVDEARTPLIISGSTDEKTDKYYKVSRIVPRLNGEIYTNFSQNEFSDPSDIEKLCRTIQSDNFGFTINAPSNNAEWLSEFLNQPGLFVKWKSKKANLKISLEINDLANKTAGFRNQDWNELNDKHKHQIKKLNRMILEQTYTGGLCPTSQDYELDEKSKAVYLTEKGQTRVEDLLQIDDMFTAQNIEYQHHVTQAIRAHYLFKTDVDYIVTDGKIVIVDEFTGRLMPGRRWSDGLHQAIEAKENVVIESENQTIATITFQNLFKLYNKLGGMTGTAETEASEFLEIYKLDCVVIPTNMPCVREDHNDQIYRTFPEKINAIIEEIEEKYKTGQPVLVGTISIERSELLSRELKKKNIPHQVLNAKYHEKEATIIQQAGIKGSITIATNMAGRGTDIVLGGYPEFKEELKDNITVTSDAGKQYYQLIVQGDITEAKKMITEFKGPDKDKAAAVLIKTALKQYDFVKAEEVLNFISSHNMQKDMKGLLNRVREWEKEHEEIKELGGLHILGTERHESRRIDNQLRGRAGRQGDPGSSRFFISLEDELMRLFGSDRMSSVMQRLGLQEGENIQHPWISKAIENAQKKVEARNFDIRKHLLEYDNVMNTQRGYIYNKRNSILDEAVLKEDIMDSIQDTIELKMERIFGVKTHSDNWDMETFNNFMFSSFGTRLNLEELDIKNYNFETFSKYISDTLIQLYEIKETEVTPQIMRQLERAIILDILDDKWKEHLYAMDQLQESVRWSYKAEKDPLVEYKFQGFNLFEELLDNLQLETLQVLFKVETKGIKDQIQMISQEESSYYGREVHSEFEQFDALKLGPAQEQGSGEQPQPQVQIRRSRQKIGRNEPCWCGSGKKFKHCHGKS